MTALAPKEELDQMVNDGATVRLISGYKRGPLCQIAKLDDDSGRYKVSNEWFKVLIKPEWVLYSAYYLERADIHVETWVLADVDINPPLEVA